METIDQAYPARTANTPALGRGDFTIQHTSPTAKMSGHDTDCNVGLIGKVTKRVSNPYE